MVTGASVSCSPSICTIDYCSTCLTVSTCSACSPGFSLAIDQKTCISDCSSVFANCLLCNSTDCHLCHSPYTLSPPSTCLLTCSTIANCIACYTPTQCALCDQGYQVSGDYLSCRAVCLVEGCQSCSSPLALDCIACSSGYVSYTDGSGLNKCALECGEGQVNTGTGGIVNCQYCHNSISYSSSCTYSAVSSTFAATSCL